MTPQQDRQEAALIDIETAAERTARILHGDSTRGLGSVVEADAIYIANAPKPKPARAPRKDKGKPRVKPAPAAPTAPGLLSPEQADKLRHMAEWVRQCQATYENADRALKQGVADYNAYLDSLTANI